MSIRYIALSIVLFLPALTPPHSWSFEVLSDQELHAVSAGSVDRDDHGSYELNRIPFRYTGTKGEVDGEVIVLPMTDVRNQSSLQLMDNAQSNLRSLINVNAVNSPVQVLLNLNININSNIGAVNQLNSLLSRQ